MERKPKYTLFPTHPLSSPPTEPLPPLPEGQRPSSSSQPTSPRPTSSKSARNPQTTFPALPLQGVPHQPHSAFSSPPLHRSSPQQPSASFPPPSSHGLSNVHLPATSSSEPGPPPQHFDPNFPPSFPDAPPPARPHIANPPPHLQASLPQHPREPLTPPAELEANSPWPPLNNSWPQHEDGASTLKGTPTPAESTSPPEKKMHTSTLSTSTSSSESSLHKPANIVTPTSQPQNGASSTRPRTVYFHSGLGGAGNYHKAIREDNVLKPMLGNRSNHPRFLSSLLGTLGGKKSRRHQQQQQYDGGGSGNSSDGTGSGQSSSQTLPLGAAEVMRRKMLGLDGKARTKV